MAQIIAPQEFKVTNKAELQTHLDNITTSLDNYISIKDRLENVEKGQQLQVNGLTIDKNKLKAMHNQIVKSIKEIPKYVTFPKKAKAKSDDAKPRSNGFDNPVFVNKHIVKFFTENPASLGLDPKTRQALNALLPLLVKSELTTSSILTSLWTIYTNVQKDKVSTTVSETDAKTNKVKETKFYHADDNMNRHFGPQGSNTFAVLSAKPAKVGKNDKVLPAFNPSKFSYTAWQSIYSNNKLSLTGAGENKLTPERDALLKAMKEWKTLSNLSGTDLTLEKQADISAINTRIIPPSATPEKRAYLTNLMNAKQYHDQLILERDIVSNTLKTINDSKPKPAKKSRAKSSAVPANGIANI
jgi:hypothetical protein